MSHHSIRFALIAICVVSTCARSRAGTILDPLSEGYEAMMTSQSQDGASLGLAFGSSPAQTLNFSSFVDPTARTFSYTLNAGQTFHGQPLSLTTSGVFNVAQNRYDVNTTGLLGVSAFNRSSTIAFNPDLTIDASSDWNTPPAPNSPDESPPGTGIRCVITSRTTLFEQTVGNIFVSSLTYTATLTYQGNTTTLGQGTGTDRLDWTVGKWEDKLRPWFISGGPPVPGTDVSSDSVVPIGAGAGQFKMVIDLPEPAAGAVFLSFAVAVVRTRHRARKSG